MAKSGKNKAVPRDGDSTSYPSDESKSPLSVLGMLRASKHHKYMPPEIWTMIAEYAVIADRPISSLKLSKQYRKLLQPFKDTNLRKNAEASFWANNTIHHPISPSDVWRMESDVKALKNLSKCLRSKIQHLYITFRYLDEFYEPLTIANAVEPFANLKSLTVQVDVEGAFRRGPQDVALLYSSRMVRDMRIVRARKIAVVLTSRGRRGGLDEAKGIEKKIAAGEVERIEEDRSTEEVAGKLLHFKYAPLLLLE